MKVLKVYDGLNVLKLLLLYKIVKIHSKYIVFPHPQVMIKALTILRLLISLLLLLLS